MPLEILEASVVVLGSFNPPIITVDWLLSNSLIGKGDADVARASEEFVVSRQVTKFETDAVRVQVLENQLSINSVGPVNPALGDLAMSVLMLLPHTPVTALGLNFMAHYKMPSVGAYHRVGDSLAPKKIWEAIFPDKALGLASLVIRVQDGARNEAPKSPNAKNITIQPSSRIAHGVHVMYNDHYGHGVDQEPLKTASGGAEVIRTNWSNSHKEALECIESLLMQASQEGVS